MCKLNCNILSDTTRVLLTYWILHCSLRNKNAFRIEKLLQLRPAANRHIRKFLHSPSSRLVAFVQIRTSALTVSLQFCAVNIYININPSPLLNTCLILRSTLLLHYKLWDTLQEQKLHLLLETAVKKELHTHPQTCASTSSSTCYCGKTRSSLILLRWAFYFEMCRNITASFPTFPFIFVLHISPISTIYRSYHVLNLEQQQWAKSSNAL